MIQICPVCETDIGIPEVDGDVFECPRCRTKLQAFHISGFWEVHRYMGKFRADEDDDDF